MNGRYVIPQLRGNKMNISPLMKRVKPISMSNIKNSVEKDSTLYKRLAYDLLVSAGGYMTHLINIYASMINSNYEIGSKKDIQLKNCIMMIYKYIGPKKVLVTDEDIEEINKINYPEVIGDSFFKFQFINNDIKDNDKIIGLMNIYNNDLTSKIEEARDYIKSKINERFKNKIYTWIKTRTLLKIYDAIIEIENKYNALFTTPRNELKRSGELSYIDSFFSYIQDESGKTFSKLDITDKDIERLSTARELQNIITHGIEYANGNYIGYVTHNNIKEKMKQYQEIQKKSMEEIIEQYESKKEELPNDLKFIKENLRLMGEYPDPIEYSNVQLMGKDDMPNTPRKCSMSFDKILPEFIIPKGEGESGSNDIPYNKRQIVYGHNTDLKKYRECNKYFRTEAGYVDPIADIIIKEGISYSPLYNIYFTMKASQTDMLFPIRFILPSSRRMLSKHPGKQILDKYLEEYNFIGLIEYNYIDYYKSYRIVKKVLLIFDSNEDRFNTHAGKKTTFYLIDYQLTKVNVGHLHPMLIATFNEFNMITNPKYLDMPIYKYKGTKPGENQILFVHNEKMGSIDGFEDKLEPFTQYDIEMYTKSVISNVHNTIKYGPDEGHIIYGGGDGEVEKIKKNSIIHLSSCIFTVLYTEMYKKDKNRIPLSSFEFVFLLYPYIYITNHQYSGFISYNTPKYKKIYTQDKIIGSENSSFNEIIKYNNISTKNKNILEINNTNAVSIIHIKNSKNLSIFLYPNVKYYTINYKRVSYKGYDTRVYNQFKVIKIDKKDIIIYNLSEAEDIKNEYENEYLNIKYWKILIKFIKLNLNKDGTLIMMITMNTNDGKKCILKLQKLFKTVSLHRLNIKHVFKQVGLVLVCKGFGYKPTSNYTLKSLEQLNNGIHLNKFKFYYDLFAFYDKFKSSSNIYKIIDKQKEWQLLMSYLYAKEWKLKFSIKVDKQFLQRLKDNLSSLFHNKAFSKSLKEIKYYYNKFPKNDVLHSKIDWSLPHYGTVQTMIDTNKEYAELHGHSFKNIVTNSMCKEYGCEHKFELGVDSIKGVWELYLRYPEITIYKPSDMVEADHFYIKTKGKRDDQIKIPKRYNKYFVIEFVTAFKKMVELYAKRIEYEVLLLKYKKWLKPLL